MSVRIVLNSCKVNSPKSNIVGGMKLQFHDLTNQLGVEILGKHLNRQISSIPVELFILQIR